MPKGGNLHLHDASVVPIDWIIETLTYLPDLYTKERVGNAPRIFKFSKTPLDYSDGWQEVAQLRAQMGKTPSCCGGVASTPGNRSLDEIFLSELSLFTSDPYNTYKSANDIWSKFGDYFTTFNSLRSSLETAELCLKKAVEDFYADGIQYGEFREGFLYDANGTDLTENYMDLVKKVVTEFQATHPDFLGIKFILTGHRRLWTGHGPALDRLLTGFGQKAFKRIVSLSPTPFHMGTHHVKAKTNHRAVASPDGSRSESTVQDTCHVKLVL
ncbi:adenosine deaminase CECR1 [Elysia marginata]|uniref:Adenosine deaminase CECR1 n=1 Tax=Elysia marginata TaxID=1093978 RepID=A0AAV4FBZ1_9GAST|nr:adenosine deaminase CECR1 [Elysia marginata]